RGGLKSAEGGSAKAEAYCAKSREAAQYGLRPSPSRGQALLRLRVTQIDGRVDFHQELRRALNSSTRMKLKLAQLVPPHLKMCHGGTSPIPGGQQRRNRHDHIRSVQDLSLSLADHQSGQ